MILALRRKSNLLLLATAISSRGIEKLKKIVHSKDKNRFTNALDEGAAKYRSHLASHVCSIALTVGCDVLDGVCVSWWKVTETQRFRRGNVSLEQNSWKLCSFQSVDEDVLLLCGAVLHARGAGNHVNCLAVETGDWNRGEAQEACCSLDGFVKCSACELNVGNRKIVGKRQIYVCKRHKRIFHGPEPHSTCYELNMGDSNLTHLLEVFMQFFAPKYLCCYELPTTYNRTKQLLLLAKGVASRRSQEENDEVAQIAPNC